MKYFEVIRRNRYINIFVINLRFLIGFGFLPSGITKILDNPFTRVENTGVFFDYLDALHQTGFYYNLIGWAQVIAAILLITQRFATLGAFLFLPIIFNIAALTLSTIGSFTPFIATLMLLGIIFLLFWDYYKWINIISPDNKLIMVPLKNDYPTYNTVWLLTGICLLVIPSLIVGAYSITGDPHKGAVQVVGSIVAIPIIGFVVDEFRYRKARKLDLA